MSDELQRVDDDARLQPAQPPSLLQIAIQQGVNAEQLSKLMDLQERQDKAKAAAAFAVAMTRFQSLMPIVRKKRTATGKFSYQFAGYDDIVRVAGPILALCGLVVTFKVGESKPGQLTIACHVTHGTHTEITELKVPIPDMVVNDTQKYGAAISYGKRFAFNAALNIIVSDEDDDAVTQLNTITEAQAEEVTNLVNRVAAATGMQVGNFMGWVREVQPGCESIADLACRNLPKITGALNHKLKQKPGVAK